jgi:hypothetical protein
METGDDRAGRQSARHVDDAEVPSPVARYEEHDRRGAFSIGSGRIDVHGAEPGEVDRVDGEWRGRCGESQGGEDHGFASLRSKVKRTPPSRDQERRRRDRHRPVPTALIGHVPRLPVGVELLLEATQALVVVPSLSDSEEPVGEPFDGRAHRSSPTAASRRHPRLKRAKPRSLAWSISLRKR